MALSPSWRRTLSLLWIGAIAILVAVFAYQERDDIVRAIPYLKRANYRVLISTTMCEIIYFILQAIGTTILYNVYNVRARLSIVTGMLFHATMLNEVMPTSGASGTAGFIFWGNRMGYGLRTSISVSIWLSLLSYIAIIPPVIACIRVLFMLPKGPQAIIWNAVKIGIVFTMILVLVAVLWTLYLVLAKWAGTFVPSVKNHVFARLVGKIQNKLHWYTKNELRKEWNIVSSHPWRMFITLVLLFSIYPVRVCMLMLCFMAIHYPIGWSVAIYAYSLTLLFSVVSLAPTTLGVVEIALTTALSWFGVPLPIALAGTLLYRISSFWLPIPVGLLYHPWLLSQVQQHIKAP